MDTTYSKDELNSKMLMLRRQIEIKSKDVEKILTDIEYLCDEAVKLEVLIKQMNEQSKAE